MAENIITLIVVAWTAFIMIVVGVFQMKSIQPVGFYTCAKPLKREQISDVATWNKKHGTMWVTYGVAMILACMMGIFVTNEVLFGTMFTIVIVGAIPVMMVYHHWLKGKHYINR